MGIIKKEARILAEERDFARLSGFAGDVGRTEPVSGKKGEEETFPPEE